MHYKAMRKVHVHAQVADTTLRPHLFMCTAPFPRQSLVDKPFSLRCGSALYTCTLVQHRRQTVRHKRVVTHVLRDNGLPNCSVALS